MWLKSASDIIYMVWTICCETVSQKEHKYKCQWTIISLVIAHTLS